MKLDFDAFVVEAGNAFSGRVDLARVRALLEVEEDYNYDSELSSNSRLVLRFIQFDGKKSNGDPILFEHRFGPGLNMIIADNLKGKSSIFKIIKFALTGKNSLKADVKSWLGRVLLNFDIDGELYAVLLDFRGNRLSSKLVRSHPNSLAAFDDRSLDIVFFANAENRFQDLMQNFFFTKFGYYSLQWTQKDSRKDNLELNLAGISLRTIFKSMYLESKDSNKLFYGDQGTKIFQILLGLPLTFPINRLSVRRDLASHELAKVEATHRPHTKKQEILDELKNVNEKLKLIENEKSDETDVFGLYRMLDSLIGKLNAENSKIVENSTRLRNLYKERSAINDSISQGEVRASVNQRESLRIEREKLRLMEFLESKRFFSNLDIKSCPNCDQGVEESHVTCLSDNECSLCHRVLPDDGDFDDSAYRARIEALSLASDQLEVEKVEIASALATLSKEQDLLDKTIVACKDQVAQVENTDTFKNQILEVEAKINQRKMIASIAGTELEGLKAKKAVLEYRIVELQDNHVDHSRARLAMDIEVLNFAIDYLQRRRMSEGGSTLRALEKLMLKEIHQLGLTSITEIEIADTFNIQYKQHGTFLDFEDIAEGERLRAKLALYLSLIQLEVDNGVGRHLTCLIIDSPAKEEGDSHYLQGLSEVLRNIEQRLGTQLQIIIGTAERSLAGVASNERVFASDEFVF